MSVAQAAKVYPRREDLIEWATGEWRKAGPDFDMPDDYRELILDHEFSPSLAAPSVRYVVKSIQSVPKIRRQYKTEQSLLFNRGAWAEYLGLDMSWHLAPIRRVARVVVSEVGDAIETKAARLEEDVGLVRGRNQRLDHATTGEEVDVEDEGTTLVEFYYSFGRRMVSPADVRLSETAVREIYGGRPLLWMQYAVLQLETMVRFQTNHEDDFQSLNFRAMAKNVWKEWLTNPSNTEFLALVTAVEEKYRGSYAKLVGFVLSPFAVMDAMANSQEWEFERVSLYTYLAVFGTGFLLCTVVLLVQFAIPAILLITAMSQSGGSLSGIPNDGVVLRFSPGWFQTDWETFCSASGPIEGRLMQLVVIVVYVIRVLPDLFYNFFVMTGEANTALSKLYSLRKIVWDQADDSVGQQIGFRWLTHMKTLYISVSLTVLLMVLFLTPSIFDIILNALALDFVYTLDEQIGEMPAFDGDQRYIRAGAIELEMRRTLRTEYLADARTLCAVYGIDPETYEAAMSKRFGKQAPLWSPSEAEADADDPAFISKEKRFQNQMAELSRRKGNRLGMKYFDEPVVTYGIVETLLARFGFFQHDTIFDRYRGFYAWNRWETALFLPRVPTVDQFHEKMKVMFGNQVGGREDDDDVEEEGGERGDEHHHSSAGRVLNFSSRVYLSTWKKFLVDSVDVLSFRNFGKVFRVALRRRMYVSIAFHLLDACVEWFAYCYQFAFPGILMAYFLLEAVCY